ncbi:MAG: hypothetical protein LUD40_00380 [Phocaeicola dorei]|nr:hypothetical protein [Phocaeicola dorei]
MNYTNRFGDKKVCPKNLSFTHNIGDVIKKDGIIQIITGFGIYGDQYWTEKIYEDGCRLSCGDFEIVRGAKYCIIEGVEKENAMKAYLISLADNVKQFPWLKECTSAHLESLKNLIIK